MLAWCQRFRGKGAHVVACESSRAAGGVTIVHHGQALGSSECFDPSACMIVTVNTRMSQSGFSQ